MSPGVERLYDEYWSRAAPPPTVDPLAPVRQRLLWSRVPATLTSGRLLDVGAGDGSLLAAALERGLEATGLDVSERALAVAGRNAPGAELVRHALDDEAWPVEPESFDIVTSFEVIEHLLAPREFVRGAFNSLKGGGHFGVTTPYHGWFKNVVVAAVAFEHHFDPLGEHIRFFSDKTLRKLLETEGFQVLELVHFGRRPPLWAGTFVWARKP